MYYKIKENILWRNEKNSFMVLHPISKKLMIFWKQISDFISKTGIIDWDKINNKKLLNNLVNDFIIEKIDNKIPDDQIFWSDQYITAPLNITIQITNRCNLQCLHCHRVDKWLIDFDKEKFMNLVDELYEMKVFNINISWWEPLLYKWLFDIIKYIQKKWMKVTMSTNLLLWNEVIANKMYKLWIRQLHVSLDSADEKYHNYIRWYEKAYSTTLKNLEIIKKAGIEFTLVTTLVDQTIEDYWNVIDLAYSLWASSHKTNLLVPQWQWSDLKVRYYRDKDLLKKYISVFFEKKESYTKRMTVMAETMFSISMGENLNNKPGIFKVWCPAWVLTWAITEKWEVLACPFYSELVVGNIYEGSFKNIWQNSKLLWKIRNAKWNIHSWCQARAYWKNKIIEENDSYEYENLYNANDYNFYHKSAENRNIFIRKIWHWIVIEWEKWNKEFYWLIHNYLLKSDLTLEIWTWNWIVPQTLGNLWKKMISIDFSDNMLKIAKENCSIYANVLFKKENVHNLSFKDNMFDLIIKRLAPDNFDQIYRILKSWWNFINFTNWENDWKELKEIFNLPYHESVEEYRSKLNKSWYNIIYEQEFEFKEIYTDFDILVHMLTIAPIIPDFMDRQDYYIQKIKKEFDKNNKFILTRHKYLTNARK